MVAADLLRPLNHDYIPNIDNLWPQFQNPWYDAGWRYSVPYTVYTTGIGWRTDMVSRGHRRSATTPTTSSGTRSTPGTSRSSTTGTRRWRWCCCATGSTTSTPRKSADLALVRDPAARTCSDDDEARRSPSRCTTTCRPASTACARCGRATSSTRSTTCPKGAVGRRAALLVPTRTAAAGRQRPDGAARAGQEPGRGALLPQLPARRRRSRPTTSATSATSRRSASINPAELVADGFVPDEPGDRDGPAAATSPRASGCSQLPLDGRHRRTTRSGRSSRPVADRPAPGAGTGLIWPAAGAARHRCGSRCSSSRRCTSSWRSCSARSTRSCASRCRSGTRCTGTSASSATCSRHIVGHEGFFGPALLRTARLRRARQRCCAC